MSCVGNGNRTGCARGTSWPLPRFRYQQIRSLTPFWRTVVRLGGLCALRVMRPDHSVVHAGEMFSPFSKKLGVPTRTLPTVLVPNFGFQRIVCGQRAVATDTTLRLSGASETAHTSGAHADPIRRCHRQKWRNVRPRRCAVLVFDEL